MMTVLFGPPRDSPSPAPAQPRGPGGHLTGPGTAFEGASSPRCRPPAVTSVTPRGRSSGRQVCLQQCVLSELLHCGDPLPVTPTVSAPSMPPSPAWAQ